MAYIFDGAFSGVLQGGRQQNVKCRQEAHPVCPTQRLQPAVSVHDHVVAKEEPASFGVTAEPCTAGPKNITPHSFMLAFLLYGASLIIPARLDWGPSRRKKPPREGFEGDESA